MAQTRDHLGLSGSLGVRLTPTVHPLHHAVGGLALGTAAYMLSPALVPAVRLAGGLGTGVVPMLGETMGYLAARRWITLHPITAAGVAGGGVVGAVNLIVNRDKIGAFARDKYEWILNRAFPHPDPGGTHRSQPGDGPIPSLSQRTSRSPRFGKRRRRCKHRNKAGKQCLRPAGHSGRHRYR